MYAQPERSMSPAGRGHGGIKVVKVVAKMNELAWRHHFPIISLWEIFRPQGQLTP